MQRRVEQVDQIIAAFIQVAVEKKFHCRVIEELAHMR